MNITIVERRLIQALLPLYPNLTEIYHTILLRSITPELITMRILWVQKSDLHLEILEHHLPLPLQ